MPLKRKHIAIIGTGISGLGAAYLLHPHHDIVVYEKNAYVGGHSRTVAVETEAGAVPVDTGFIVFNDRNYPLLTSLFAHLNVPVAKSDMSFGASIHKGWMEYGTQHLSNVFAQKRNLLRPDFWRMISDVLRFNKQAKTYLERDPALTLGECLHQLRLGAWFREYYSMNRPSVRKEKLPTYKAATASGFAALISAVAFMKMALAAPLPWQRPWESRNHGHNPANIHRQGNA